MAKESTIKTIFALDGETKYKEAIKDINREQKELRSEMSRATSAYQLHGDELRYNREKAEILTKQYELQKRRVDELKNAVEQSSRIHGENSSQTQNLRTQLNYAESDLFKLQKQMEEATAKASKFGQSMLDAGEKITNAGEKMKSTGDKMTKAITLPVVALATAGVKTVAEMEAVNAQFEQVFGDFGNTAQKEIDRLSDEFGMLPNRIKPMFTRLTSQFKGLGADTEDAMKKASDATTLAADAAAFFDKSLEDVQTNLNSFIKGNYEGGESIGLFAKETQLATWSAENLGLEWKKLGEMDKQFARLAYAQAMYDASGATGQAAREADQFENQLGNLKQAAKDTLAELAAPLLEPTIDVMKTLGGVLQDVAEWFGNLSDKQQDFVVKAVLIGAASGPVLSGIGRVTKGIGGIVETIGKLTTDAEAAGNMLSTMGKVGVAGAIAIAATAIISFVTEITKIDPAVKRAQDSLKSLDGDFKDMTAEYLAQSDLINQYRNNLVTLMGEEDKSVATKRRIQSVVERLNQLVPDLNLAYDEQADKLNMSADQMDRIIVSSREMIKEQLKQDLINKLLEEEGNQLEDIIKFQIEIEELTKARKEIEKARNAALLTGLSEEQLRYAEMSETSRNYHSITLELTDEQTAAVENLKKVVEDQTVSVERATGRQIKSFNSSKLVLYEIDIATKKTKESADQLGNLYEGMPSRMEEYETTLDDILDEYLGLEKKQGDLAYSTEDSAKKQSEAIKRLADDTIPVWEQLGKTQEEYEKSLEDHAKKIEDRTKENVRRMNGFSDERIDYEKITVKKFIEIKKQELEAFTNYENNLQTITKRTSREFADQLREMGDDAAPLVARIATASDKELAELETIFRERSRAAKNAAKNEFGQLPGIVDTYIKSISSTVTRNEALLNTAGHKIGMLLIRGTKTTLKAQSPSKVGIEIGEDWDESIVMGAENKLPRVEDAGRKVGDALSSATLPTPAELSMQLDVIRRVTTVGGGMMPVTPVSRGSVGQSESASVPPAAVGGTVINVQVPYDESEDFGRRIGRMVMTEMQSAEMSRGG